MPEVYKIEQKKSVSPTSWAIMKVDASECPTSSYLFLIDALKAAYEKGLVLEPENLSAHINTIRNARIAAGDRNNYFPVDKEKEFLARAYAIGLSVSGLPFYTKLLIKFGLFPRRPTPHK